MAALKQMQAQLLEAGEGEIVSTFGVTLNLKTTNMQSNGEWFTMEYTAPPNFEGPPPHVHKLMTEIFYVVHGTLTVRVEDETHALGAGGYAFVPPGTLHQFSNPSDAPVKFFGVATPNLLEPYMNEMRELMADEPQWPPQDMSKIIALMAKYDTYA